MTGFAGSLLEVAATLIPSLLVPVVISATLFGIMLRAFRSENAA